MSVSSFKKILKGLDKSLEVTGNVADKLGGATDWIIKDVTASAVGIGSTGLGIAKGIKNLAFEEMTEEMLEESTSILEHLTGIKAKKRTNQLAFGAIGLYALSEGIGNAERERSMGTIVGADFQPNLVNQSTNPVTDSNLEYYNKNESYRNQIDYDMENKFGSAGADIVFALHELRNRG